MKFIVVIILSVFPCCMSRPVHYTTANAHSHNDYEQANPFHKAWQNKFGSIEADIYLHNDELVVAHDSTQLSRRWLLDSLYLAPLQEVLKKNKGYLYDDTTRSLQLMIDIKSGGELTLAHLIDELDILETITNSPSLKIVISGNRPQPEMFSRYPSWIMFDGELNKDYSPEALQKIEMLSDNFANYSTWKGTGTISSEDREALKQAISKAHRLNKKVRFWNAPDSPAAWKLFMDLQADYINTDKIGELASFLGNTDK